MWKPTLRSDSFCLLFFPCGFSEGFALSFLKESSVGLHRRGHLQWPRMTNCCPSIHRWVSQHRALPPGRGRGARDRRACRVHVLLRGPGGRAADLHGCSASSLWASDVPLLATGRWGGGQHWWPRGGQGSCDLSLLKSLREAMPVNAEQSCDLNQSPE